MQQSVALGVKADITISDFSGAGQQGVAGSETRDNSIEAKPSPAWSASWPSTKLGNPASAALRGECNGIVARIFCCWNGARFGANALANQFQLEDEQARKKRLAAMNAAQGGIGFKLAAGYGAALGSYGPAGAMLFGDR